MSGEPPRVRLDCAATAGGLGRVLQAATGMLADAGLIRLAGPDEPAEVVHTVGEVAPWRGPGTAHRVHTVDRVVLRRRGLAVTAGWAHRQRRFAGGAGTWLVHGRMAAQVLVGAGVVDGDRVHGLPLVAPPGPPAGKLDRSSVRDRLGIAPGVVLVVGADHGPGQSVPGWAETIGRLHRTDVVVMRHEPGGSLAFDELLLAADLFVAAGLALTACNPGAAAVAAGVPVIAATTDSAAELVRFGRTGFVVPPHPAAIAAGVRASLDGVLPRGAPRPPRQRIEALLHPVARGLLSGYHRALATRRAPAARSRP
ncbi:glycosyltransferase [Amycolatopsis pithecellobii]|nr:glycosyltransferase [Amycolatopsis pithecellobii]